MCRVKHNTIPSDLQFSLDKSEIRIQVKLPCQIGNQFEEDSEKKNPSPRWDLNPQPSVI